MQCVEEVAAVPDFLNCYDLFSPDDDWACGIGEDPGADAWTMSCFNVGDVQTQLSGVLPDDLALCLVPSIDDLSPDSSRVGEESSGASDHDTMTPMSVSYQNFSGQNTERVLGDECVSSAQVAKAGTEVLDPEDGSITTRSSGPTLKLQLDHGKVLSAWAEMGGSVASDAGTTAQPPVTLRLPPPELSDSLRASLPSYDLADPSCALPVPTGLEGLGLNGGELSGGGRISGGGGFRGNGDPLRMASMQSTARCDGLFSNSLATLPIDDVLLSAGGFGSCAADFNPRGGFSGGLSFSGSLAGSVTCLDSDCASEDSCFAGALVFGGGTGGGSLMPAIPGSYSAGSLLPLPQSLACIPAKATECAKSARAACFVRYKKKKQNRKSGKIRYEMRKINAEKRPRIRGRFVKREELSMMLAAGELLPSPRSAPSSVSESSWL